MRWGIRSRKSWISRMQLETYHCIAPLFEHCSCEESTGPPPGWSRLRPFRIESISSEEYSRQNLPISCGGGGEASGPAAQPASASLWLPTCSASTHSLTLLRMRRVLKLVTLNKEFPAPQSVPPAARGAGAFGMGMLSGTVRNSPDAGVHYCPPPTPLDRVRIFQKNNYSYSQRAFDKTSEILTDAGKEDC